MKCDEKKKKSREMGGEGFTGRVSLMNVMGAFLGL
jgi:hypothetical protein